MEQRLNSLVERLERAVEKLEGKHGDSHSAAAAPEELQLFVKEFDAILAGPVAAFVALSNKIGGDAAAQGKLFTEAFAAQRTFLAIASKSKQPNSADLEKLLKPISEKISEIQKLRESKRTSPLFNHLSAVSESIPALGWITVAPAPTPYVKEMADAGQFFTNRVLKDFKEKDQAHVEWARALNSIWAELQAYVKSNHTTGVSWNAKGGNALTVAAGTSPSAAVAAHAPPPPPSGGPPPPPPPMPVLPPVPAAPAAAAGSAGADPSALFAELNKGSDITKGLKKVSDDMKTHKNPALRSGPAPFKPAAAPKPLLHGSPSKPANATSHVPSPAAATRSGSAAGRPAAAPQKPPVLELQGKKWAVEYQSENHAIVIDDTEIKQNVYIFHCINSTIQIKGKINSVTLDSCRKTAVVCEDIIAVVEFINCQSVKAQVTGKVPTVSIEKTDGCQLYMSKASTDCAFITSKSSEMNVLYPKDDGDYVECAIPEQFKSSWNGKGLTTAATELAG